MEVWNAHMGTPFAMAHSEGDCTSNNSAKTAYDKSLPL